MAETQEYHLSIHITPSDFACILPNSIPMAMGRPMAKFKFKGQGDLFWWQAPESCGKDVDAESSMQLKPLVTVTSTAELVGTR